MSEDYAGAADGIDAKDKGANALAEEVMDRCIRIVAQVNTFKRPRLTQIQKYRDLEAGVVKKKFRQPFNVVLPVFAGAMDTLRANFNDDLALEMEQQEPADYIPVKKLNALWNMEATSLSPNALFTMKARMDRSNAMLSGRGFMMEYAKSEPEYQNCFEIYELEDAIFQPNGGGHLEWHLYNGRQNIVRSEAALQSSYYDKGQVAKLLKNSADTDFWPFDDFNDTQKAELGKFRAMGLDVTSADYFGERLFKLAEMRITVKGVKYYILFSPLYRTWLRFDKLSALFSADIDPWISWQTHEDNKNFISKSYADDFYSIADAVHTLFNQELTNREKSNLGARAYDREMFPDVAALDKAQTRPDALVPVDTKGGVRKISDGIYRFDTPELQGTINLISWAQQEAGKDIGVTDLSMGGAQGVSKRATVIMAEQQAISKRFLLRSSSYTEAMGQVGRIFIQAAKDHLPAEKALKRLGIEGEGWEAVIKRTDLDLYGDVDVRIISSTQEMKNSQLKKEARQNALTAIGADPLLAPAVNPSWRAEELLRSVGEYDDQDIKIAMDTKNYGNRLEIARAHEAIEEIQAGTKPDPFYGATTIFMQTIHDFAVDNRNSLGMAKYQQLIQYEMAHAPIVQQNLIRKAQDDARAQLAAAPPGAAPTAGAPAPGAAPTATGAPPPPANPPAAPSPLTTGRQVAKQLP